MTDDHTGLQDIYTRESLPLSCKLKKQLGLVSSFLRSQLEKEPIPVPFLIDDTCPVGQPYLACYGPLLGALTLARIFAHLSKRVWRINNMRLMVFSDVHANLEALRAVLRDAKKRQVNRSIFLGDLVGYGPYPNECVELMRSLKNCRCLAGNHDVAALWETSPYGMSSSAKKAILWTMDQLSDDNKKYLESLPRMISSYHLYKTTLRSYV